MKYVLCKNQVDYFKILSKIKLNIFNNAINTFFIQYLLKKINHSRNKFQEVKKSD